MPTQLLDYFSSLVADEESLPLTEAALAVAQDAYPTLDIMTALAEIDGLADRFKTRIAEGTAPLQKMRLLNRFFYKELGFGPNRNDYYDPDNSHLNVLLKTRRGIPISLAILYMEIGQQIGLPLRGVSFPNHFLVRMSVPAGEVFVDPLTGTTLSKERLQEMLDPYLEQQRDAIADMDRVSLPLFLQPATPREILARLLRNLKAIYLRDERWQRLLGVQQRLVILLPDNVEEVRDRGMAYANMEYFRPALEDLQAYLDAHPEARDAEALRNRMPKLKQLGRSVS
ncbi:MAG: SirB1 family protein, partial [Candidatus Protistobacter heckmanni]|nr:SirB1 family protein [Candidatus Protistobacter heckmanni]